ncbi:MAG: hypothetical protein FJX52_03980 [Alphaproteobacteria bacterium]|nr:hypothetical protein [Alphaproteobacteria bacterium]
MTSVSAAPFLLALTLGAFLLFWQQPLVARLLLPGLGGSPSVWAVCLTFFQAALLAGYAYAHLAQTRLTPRAQAWVDLGLLILAGASLPIALDVTTAPPTNAMPEPWLLGRLVMAVAPSFVVAAATAPMLQGWFASSGRDPYFLYAASNIGSFAALLLFPFVFESNFDLVEMKRGWAIGYGVLIAATMLCAIGLGAARPALAAAQIPSIGRRMAWLALSFVPSALLVSMTQQISTDIAAFPLLWVMPLSLYLLSFVNAFAVTPPVSARAAAAIATVMFAVLATYTSLGLGPKRVAVIVGLHCLLLFAVALALHGQLAALRPSPAGLSAFYLWLAAGGALGGSFVALLGPLLFDSIVEYRLALVAAALLMPGRWPGRDRPIAGILDFVLPLLMALALWLWPDLGLWPEGLAWLLLALMLCGLYRPLRMALAVTVAFFGFLFVDISPDTLHRSRNFFGVHLVRDEGAVRVLRHGTTLHGGQSLEWALRGQPLGYYHPQGPAGNLLMAQGGTDMTAHVGIVGLGIGSLLQYADTGESWTYFEIDPDVIRIARDASLFTVLADAKVRPRIVEGDARLSLAREPDRSFSLLVLDAFSSDAIPAHLLTLDAFELYRRKLRPDGALLVHVTNRYLDLEPVVTRAARALGLSVMAARDYEETRVGGGDWKAGSEWMFLTPSPETLSRLHGLPFWRLAVATTGRPWSDRHADLIEAIRR